MVLEIMKYGVGRDEAYFYVGTAPMFVVSRWTTQPNASLQALLIFIRV